MVWILTLPRKLKKSKSMREVFGFSTRECLHEDIRCLVLHGTINKLDIAFVNDVPNVMVPNINVFCAGMELTLHVSVMDP